MTQGSSSDKEIAAYEPGQTCPECGALVGHWKPCSNASPELQKRWREQDAATVDDRFEKSMVECERLCNDFNRAAYQLVRYYGATLEGLREQLEEAVKDA